MYKIHQTRIAPNARRLRIFLAEKGVQNVEFVTVNILEGENLGPNFRAKNPFGRIPVLEFEDGSVLSESVAIARYFEEIQPEPPLFGVGPLGRATVEMWHRRVEISFMVPAAQAFRNISGVFKDREYCDPVYGREMSKVAVKSLKLFDDHLQGSLFLAGDNYSIADATFTAILDFALGAKVALPEDVLDGLDGLNRWREAMAARPSYNA